MKLLTLKNIEKIYGKDKAKVYALQDVNLEIDEGSMVAIMGVSGSGKSTLLNLMGLLDRSTNGDYFIDGINVKKMSEQKRALLRNEFFGFVVQDFALIEKYTVFQNIEIPYVYNKTKVKDKEKNENIKKSLIKMGLETKIHECVSNLSGGQRQRVAISRAIINNPKVILADEPTGALDSENAKHIMNIFKQLNDEGKTVVIITHDKEVASYCNKIIRISDGKILGTT